MVVSVVMVVSSRLLKCEDPVFCKCEGGWVGVGWMVGGFGGLS